eukprot:756692-Hanusia_phi.AAC.5
MAGPSGTISYIPGAPTSPNPKRAYILSPANNKSTKTEHQNKVEEKKHPANDMKPERNLNWTASFDENTVHSEHFSAEELEDTRESSEASGDSCASKELFKRNIFSNDKYPNSEIDDGASRGSEQGRAMSDCDRRQKRKRHDDNRGSRKGSTPGRSGREGHFKRHRSHHNEPRSPEDRFEKNSRTITHFFAPKSDNGEPTPNFEFRDGSNAVSGADLKTNSAPDNNLNREKELMNLEKELKRREASVESRFRELKEREQELEKRKASISELEAEARERAAAQARQDIADAAALRRQHDQRVREVMKELLIKAAREERALTGARLATDTVRLSIIYFF